MNAKNILALLLVAFMMILASCKKIESPIPLSKTEAETAFTQAEVDYTTILDGLVAEKGPSIQGTFNIYGLPTIAAKKSPTSLRMAKQIQLNKNLPSFVKVEDDTDPLILSNFNGSKGTWTYTIGVGWSPTSTIPTDKVVLVIPYGNGETATLTYSDFQTKKVDTLAYTSQINATLTVSTETEPVMTWAYTAAKTSTSNRYKFVYTFGDYTKTKTVSVDGLTSNPSKTNPKTITRATSTIWEKAGEIIYAKSFSSVSTYNLDQTYSNDIEGKYRVKDIVFTWYIHYDQTTDLSNPNNYITISVWTRNEEKVANIIFKSIAKSGYALYIKFTDGTEEPLGNYLEKLGSDIDAYTWFIKNYGTGK